MRNREYALQSKEYIDPAMIPISEDTEVLLGKTLDALNLNMLCCRAHMMSQIEFKEMY